MGVTGARKEQCLEREGEMEKLDALTREILVEGQGEKSRIGLW